MLYSINTEGKAGVDDCRYDNWLNTDITAKHRAVSSMDNQTDLSIALGINGKFRGQEKINDLDISNTGGEVIYFSPGLQLSISGFIIEASFQYPFYHRLNGAAQLGEDFKSYLSLRYVL